MCNEKQDDTKEYRQINNEGMVPETVSNQMFTPGFLRQYIGHLMRVEFLIGTNNLNDRVGILQEVGASYIVLKAIQDNNLLYCDIYSIKFVTIVQSPPLNDFDFYMPSGNLDYRNLSFFPQIQTY